MKNLKHTQTLISKRNTFFILTLFLSTVMIAGCSITPSYSYSYSAVNVNGTDKTKTDSIREYSTPKAIPSICPTYWQPSFLAIPIAPISDIVELDENAHREKLEILTKYAINLRQTIATARKRHTEAYAEYIKKCREFHATESITPSQLKINPLDEIEKREEPPLRKTPNLKK